MTDWHQGSSGHWNEKGEMRISASRVWLYSRVDSRIQNGRQSPCSDVVNTWHCGNQGHDPDLRKSRFFIIKKDG